MSFEKKLQSLRKASNLSQEELANELGVSRQAVSKWESGVSYPEMDKLILMTKIFKCTLDDLVNDEIDDKSIMKPNESKKEQKYIDSLLEFITKSINMFFSMKFSNLLRCLFELGILFLILLSITSIIVSSFYNLLEVFSFNVFTGAIVTFIGSIALSLLIALDIVIFFQVYKIRYLDYYDKLIYEYEQDKQKDIINNVDIVNEEEKDKKEVRHKLKEEKRDRIIIRDPNHHPLAFLSTISKLIILGVKGLTLCFSIPFIMSLIGFIICLVLSIYLLSVNMVFLGIIFAIIGIIVVNVQVLIAVYDFIFNKKFYSKIMFIVLLLAIFISSIGVGLTMISLKDIDFIETSSTNQIDELSKNFKYYDDLYLKLHSYEANIKYIVDNSRKDINITVYYDGDIEKLKFVNDENYKLITLETEQISISSKKIIDRFLKDLKNNKVYIDYNYSQMIEVRASEEHIKNLIKNVSLDVPTVVNKSIIDGNIVYSVYYNDSPYYINNGEKLCELNDFYYSCVVVHPSEEIRGDFKYTYKDGKLEYDKSKYECEFDAYDKSYDCYLKYYEDYE